MQARWGPGICSLLVSIGVATSIHNGIISLLSCRKICFYPTNHGNPKLKGLVVEGGNDGNFIIFYGKIHTHYNQCYNLSKTSKFI